MGSVEEVGRTRIVIQAKWTDLFRKGQERLVGVDPSVIYNRDKYRTLVSKSDFLQSPATKHYASRRGEINTGKKSHS